MTQIKLSSVTVNVHSTVPAVTVAHLEFFFFVNICFHYLGLWVSSLFYAKTACLGFLARETGLSRGLFLCLTIK